MPPRHSRGQTVSRPLPPSQSLSRKEAFSLRSWPPLAPPVPELAEIRLRPPPPRLDRPSGTMSQFKTDTIIQEIAQYYSIQSGKIDVNIATDIVLEAEMQLRVLILESLKYMRFFGHSELTNMHIDCALRNTPCQDKLMGYDIDDIKKSADGQINLKDSLINQLNALKKEVKEPSVTVSWLSINGQKPNITENQSIHSKREILEAL